MTFDRNELFRTFEFAIKWRILKLGRNHIEPIPIRSDFDFTPEFLRLKGAVVQARLKTGQHLRIKMSVRGAPPFHEVGNLDTIEMLPEIELYDDGGFELLNTSPALGRVFLSRVPTLNSKFLYLQRENPLDQAAGPVGKAAKKQRRRSIRKFPGIWAGSSAPRQTGGDWSGRGMIRPEDR